MRQLLIATWLALAAAWAFAQSLEIIELRNRPAEQILPVIQPLLAKEGTASGSGFQLIVRTTPANLAQIRQVVASLDRVPRQLVIHVRQTLGAAGAASGVGAQAALAPGDSSARANLWNNSSTAQDNVAQQVRVLEGNQAYINTGTSTLVTQRTVTRTGTATMTQESVVPRDYNTGFYVTPRVNGQTVFLDIGAQRNTPLSANAGLGKGAAGVNRVVSSVSGRLGEWIELGGVNLAQSAETSGVVT